MNKNATPNKTNSSMWRLAASVVSTAAAALLVWQGRDDFRAVWGAGVPLLSSLVLAQLGFLATQAARMKLIIENHATTQVQGWYWARLFFLGRLLNTFLIQSGNAYRLVSLRRHYGVSIGQYASSVVMQAWLATSISLILATGFSVAAAGAGSDTVTLTVILGLATLAVTAAPFLGRMIGERVGRYATLRVVSALNGILERVIDTVRDRRLAGALLLHSLLGFSAGVLILSLSFGAAGHSPPIHVAAAMLAFLQAGNVVAITPGNLGIQELGLAAVSAIAGYTLSLGVIASALIRASGLVALAVAVAASHLVVRSKPMTE